MKTWRVAVIRFEKLFDCKENNDGDDDEVEEKKMKAKLCNETCVM